MASERNDAREAVGCDCPRYDRTACMEQQEYPEDHGYEMEGCSCDCHQLNEQRDEERAAAGELPFGADRPEALAEPFCACGRVISKCDRSRAGCAGGGLMLRGVQ